MTTADSSSKTWTVYMIRCADGSLYTGISTDTERRFQEHAGSAPGQRGAKALRGRRPESVVFRHVCPDRSMASRIEARIKRLSRAQKLALVEGQVTLEGAIGLEIDAE